MGIPPLSDSSFEQAFVRQAALQAGAASMSGSGSLSVSGTAVVPFSGGGMEFGFTGFGSEFSGSESRSGNESGSGSEFGSGDSNGNGNTGNGLGYGYGYAYGMGDNDGRVNPLAGMGLTDEQYNAILQNIVNGEGIMGGLGEGGGGGPGREKRLLEDPVLDGREGKRSRFEVVE